METPQDPHIHEHAEQNPDIRAATTESQLEDLDRFDRIPPKAFPTLNSMLEHGLMLSPEAITELFPELADNQDALNQAESYLAYHLKRDVFEGFGDRGDTDEKQSAVQGVVEELIANDVVDLPENELFEIVSERLGLPIEEIESYFPLNRRYGDHS